ncbi:MAG: hypothetical protein ACRD2B_05940 [Terriglobia bacterium]
MSLPAISKYLNIVLFKQSPRGLRRFEPTYGYGTPSLAGIPLTRDAGSRVANKHRRIEERLVLDGQVIELMTTRIPEAEMTLVDSSRWKARQPGRQPTMPTEMGVRSTRTQPVVDVGQITDEVVKQLDRRLIAARERRGRI